MILLKRGSNGEYTWRRFYGGNIPPYAILSHTWRPESEEPTFQDIIAGRAKDKAGYDKLVFCGNQAEKDNLSYFWVDTCCIDKTNNTELSEALNSMFAWYKQAARCYVYLSDVPPSGGEDTLESTGTSWKLSFMQSKWFTRGWTLQELLAPPSVEFFSRTGRLLGSKETMEQEIHDITGIQIRALKGESLAGFTTDEKMAWAEGRHTTREEDAAYCMQGIFDVYMLPIYGEGRVNALRRLNREIAGTGPCEVNLFDAIRRARLDLVIDYLSHSSFIDYATADDDAENPLHVAIRIGHDGILEQLLKRQPHVDYFSGTGMTPLMLAAYCGNAKAIQRLLDADCSPELRLKGKRDVPMDGVDIEGRITTGSTALFLAAQNGHADAVRILLERGANVNPTTNEKFSPLIIASQNGHTACVKVLLEHGADTELKTNQGFTALVYCGNRGQTAIATLLLDADADIEAEKGGKMTALLEATWCGMVRFVEFIAGKGANLDAGCDIRRDYPSATALHLAVLRDNRRMVEALLRCGANPETEDGLGRTPAQLAEDLGRRSISKVFAANLDTV